MKQTQAERARQIQESIRQVLLDAWDPIGVHDVPEAQDEYDGYVGGVYRLLASGPTEKQIVDYLRSIEADAMGLPAADPAAVGSSARSSASGSLPTSGPPPDDPGLPEAGACASEVSAV